MRRQCTMIYMNHQPKLIIIRGPSASGKSTVSDELFRRTTRPTIIVSEDTIRKFFNDHQKTGHMPSRRVAEKIVITGLENGYDVIYHGILRLNDDNHERFAQILKAHPNENYFFYLDVSFEATIKRHLMRPKQNEFDVETMKKWWRFSSPAKNGIETIIPESSSVNSTIQTVSKVAGINLK